jgi:hypothetical protein
VALNLSPWSDRVCALALPVHTDVDMNIHMNRERRPRTRRVTANLPVELLDAARKVTGEGITETLVRGLGMVRRTAAAARARSLRGKLQLDVDIEGSRERARH